MGDVWLIISLDVIYLDHSHLSEPPVLHDLVFPYPELRPWHREVFGLPGFAVTGSTLFNRADLLISKMF